MALLIDLPRWPARGRLWSHLVSDTSYDELHDFARRAGVPAGSFEGDHYDVPAERYDAVVQAGARAVQGREVVHALQASGLRLPKRKGERVLATWPDEWWPPSGASCRVDRVDCLASPLGPPAQTTVGTVLLVVRRGRVLVGGETLPPAVEGTAVTKRSSATVRALATERSPVVEGVACGYLRARFADGARQHIAVVRPAAGAYLEAAAGQRWLPLDEVAATAALRLWAPLAFSLQQR